MGAKIVKVVELCNFLNGFSYKNEKRASESFGCSFDIDRIGDYSSLQL
jgi:hypothetical protein